MPRRLLLSLLLPLSAAAQQAVPAIGPLINPDGIVRGDTTRPGILSPGIVFSIWGRGYGPKAGCKGPATEVCGVQVLLDGAPIEVQYTNDLLVNARMPDNVPDRPVSRLVVVSGGRPSDPVDVRRLPETAVISLDGIAREDGPVWIHVEMPRDRVSYPPMAVPWDFACDAFEVRRDGKPLAPIALPMLGMVYSGPSCPGYPNQGTQIIPTKRLPLHLQYSFAEPGVYEVRLSHYGVFTRRPDDIRIQSAWTPIEVLPVVQRPAIPARPQGPDQVVADFLPNLLALRDDETLSVLLEYLYHPSPRVRAYAANALHYWPDAVVEPRLMAALRADGPSAVVVQRLASHPSEVADAALPYLFSDDLVLFQGAIAAAGVVLNASGPVDPELRARVEQRLVAAAAGNLGHADAQTTNDFIALLGRIHTERVHDLLWSLVARHTGVEQSLIAIAWQQDPKDLPRLAAYLIAASADDQSRQALYGVPGAMRSQFGDAASSWLRAVLDQAQAPSLRVRCAEELMRANDPTAFAFALDAIDRNRAWKPQIRSMVNAQFPETRNVSDDRLSKFLRERASGSVP